MIFLVEKKQPNGDRVNHKLFNELIHSHMRQVITKTQKNTLKKLNNKLHLQIKHYDTDAFVYNKSRDVVIFVDPETLEMKFPEDYKFVG